jgi:sugar phosphate isomerase/epimerase
MLPRRRASMVGFELARSAKTSAVSFAQPMSPKGLQARQGTTIMRNSSPGTVPGETRQSNSGPSPSTVREDRMRLHHFAVVALLLTACAAPCLAADAAPAKRDDSAAEKLGFKLALQCWTFHNLTFFESVDKAAALGIKYVEMCPEQKLKPGSDVVTNYKMSDETCAEIKKKLADAGGLKVIGYGVEKLPASEESLRKVFDWAKKMGIEVIVTEAKPNELHDKLCTEYNIKMVLHNHPKSWPPSKVLAACEGRCNLIGACADTGHWMRAGFVPLDTLKKLEGHVLHLHFKDVNETGAKAYDVPWGTGASDAKAMLQELKRQGYKGYFSIEYEHGSLDDLAENLPKCVEFFDRTAAELSQ